MVPLTRIFGLLMDPSRQRILMLLDGQELCVSEVMAVLRMPQPLVSRNLSLLSKAGLLEARRQGKKIFYRLKDPLPEPMKSLMDLMRKELADDETRRRDLQTLKECFEFEKKTGKSNMETFLRFMKERRSDLERIFEGSEIEAAGSAFSPIRS